MPKRRMHGGNAGHPGGNRGSACALRQAAAEEREEVEGAVHGHAQGDRRGHHAADVEGGTRPPQRTKEQDHWKHVGDHRHCAGHHAPLHRHHHQGDHTAG